MAVLRTTWTVHEPPADRVIWLAQSLKVHAVTAACLINRGIGDEKTAEDYLEPRLSALHPLEGIKDLSRAGKRLAEAIVSKQRIGVFGDYDVDGISSTALVSLFLSAVDAQTEVQLADRFAGYGMGCEAIDYFAARGCHLIVVVDCGTSDHEAIARAHSLGLDVVIIDHHRIDGAPPQVSAFVNPERPDCLFCDKTMAAVGLVFYFIAATRAELIRRGCEEAQDLDLRSWLDLVALGTVADVVPLRGNNRIFVTYGLRQMSRVPRDGLKSLIRLAKIRSRELRADHIAYQLAPRLNAAGRLTQAREALDLLLAQSREDADRIAVHLDQLSRERRVLEERVIDESLALIAKERLAEDRIIIVAGDEWHRGVLGIVASRLVEHSDRPVIAIGFDGDLGVGSARGRGEINLHECLSAASDHLVRFGGHRDAAGFTVERHKLPHFREAMLDWAKRSWVERRSHEVVCDARLTPNEITSELLGEISKLGPFGAGNPEPIFDIDGLWVLSKRVVGTDHLRLELKTPSGSLPAFGPRLGAFVDRIPPLIRVAANLIVDDWRGAGSPELRLVAPPVPGN